MDQSDHKERFLEHLQVTIYFFKFCFSIRIYLKSCDVPTTEMSIFILFVCVEYYLRVLLFPVSNLKHFQIKLSEK